MKYAMAFSVNKDGDICEGHNYSSTYDKPEFPRWWWKYLEGFWEDGLYWCLVEYDDDEEISS